MWGGGEVYGESRRKGDWRRSWGWHAWGWRRGSRGRGRGKRAEGTWEGGRGRGKRRGKRERGRHDGGRQVQVAANPPNQWLDLNECVDHLSPGRANDVVKMKIIVQSPC